MRELATARARSLLPALSDPERTTRTGFADTVRLAGGLATPCFRERCAMRYSQTADLGFLFLGGMHQALHLAPAALALAKRPGVKVTAYVPPLDAHRLRSVFSRLDPLAADLPQVVPLRLPLWAELVQMLLGRSRGNKPLALLAWRGRLLRHCALVAAERTSTLLKLLPGRKPIMLHIPHGAGDRAGGFDRRIRLFDHVFVSGTYVLDRSLSEGLADPGMITTIGSLKLSALLNGADVPPKLFDDDRPIVLYNPHFEAKLSSWAQAEAVVEAIVRHGGFNLIVAPHARMFAAMAPKDFELWSQLGKKPGVHFDVTSFALSDMTYTRMADIYLGDVSSQIYEFLARPRPAVFFNAHDVAWQGRADYRMWQLGEVATTIPDVVAALVRAPERHRAFRARQQEFTTAVLGATDGDAPRRAASALLAGLDRVRAQAAIAAVRSFGQGARADGF